MEKISVGVIGATGMVGQNYLRLLKEHPWFQVTHVSASPRSAGKTYAEAVAGRWVMDEDIPEAVANLVVGDASNIEDERNRKVRSSIIPFLQALYMKMFTWGRIVILAAK